MQSDPTKFCTYEEFEQSAETRKQFCLLRAGSVNAQLDGTIATTAESQEKDASSITISDMGSMGGGKGMAMPGASAAQTGNAPQKPEGTGDADWLAAGIPL